MDERKVRRREHEPRCDPAAGKPPERRDEPSLTVPQEEQPFSRHAILRELGHEGVQVRQIIAKGVEVPAAAVRLPMAAKIHEGHLKPGSHQRGRDGGISPGVVSPSVEHCHGGPRLERRVALPEQPEMVGRVDEAFVMPGLVLARKGGQRHRGGTLAMRLPGVKESLCLS